MRNAGVTWTLTAVLVLGLGVSDAFAQLNFKRGDCDGNGQVGGTVNDPVFFLNWAFLGGLDPGCLAACDTNGNGQVGGNVDDAVYYFNWSFLGGNPPPAPFPDCGSESLGVPCAVYDVPGCDQGPPEATPQEVDHILNRIAYGPSPEDVLHVYDIGVEAYIEEQLSPDTIDESGNSELNDRVAQLFESLTPSDDTLMIRILDQWRYFKGDAQPPVDWANRGFNDSGWLSGSTPIGYEAGSGAVEIQTSLDDMQNNYASVYIRKTFTATRAGIDTLVFRVDYDDGFVAYLNGTEIARAGVAGNPPLRNVLASPNHEADGNPDEFVVNKSLIVDGPGNVLAIQIHNGTLGSSDLSISPELIDRTILGATIQVMPSIANLQELPHLRGIYSRKQLQAVLAEFWENHLTTDVEKVRDYLDALQNSDASDAMSTAQAEREAAHLDYLEYQFYYENALGRFGDLLLYSATSPTMLIYLDNVLNSKVEPNENYAREIFELSAYGVDNRYDQEDIEEFARCFTGWTVCKVAATEVQSFPDSARNPPTDCGVDFEDFAVSAAGSTGMALGGSWKYFKGTEEPSYIERQDMDPEGNPITVREETLEWTELDFDDTAWLSATTTDTQGVGYEAGGDAGINLSPGFDLSDMRAAAAEGGYLTLYLRKTFTINQATLDSIENLLMELQYDDGIVVAVNGERVYVSPSLDDDGGEDEFSYNEPAEVLHEWTEGKDFVNLNRVRGLIRPAPQTNVLAIQVVNYDYTSSDLSIQARFVSRIVESGIENGDAGGFWAFRFDPDDHDTAAKIIHPGTAYEYRVTAGDRGALGVRDAIDFIDRMANHPSTREFVCIKLLQRFVSDDFTFPNLKQGLLTSAQLELLADCDAAWRTTGGSIEAVLRVILDPQNRSNMFWEDAIYRSKVKTPIEYVNSTMRLVQGVHNDLELAAENEAMGMALFTRDEPDGWSELGFDWMDTGSVLERIDFVQDLALRRKASEYDWDPVSYFNDPEMNTSAEVVAFINDLFFGGTLKPDRVRLLVEYLDTNDAGGVELYTGNLANARQLEKLQEALGLALSLPEHHFQ
jgi:uncharacterized protein (DUF1800 family)